MGACLSMSLAAWARLKDSRISMQDAVVVALIAAGSRLASDRRSRLLRKRVVPQTRQLAYMQAQEQEGAAG